MNATRAVTFGLAICAPLAFGQAPKADGAIRIWHSADRPAQQASAEHFTGAVRVEALFEPVAPSRVSASLVTFEAGARTAWHTHPVGQWLFITSGEGRVQAWGQPLQAIRRGDVVWIPAGQKHWHGAAPASSMAHIAAVEQSGGNSVSWMEKVDDAQFNTAVTVSKPQAATSPSDKPRPSAKAIGDFDPKLAEITDDLLYGDVWQRPQLSPRDRSLITVAALIAMNRPDQLRAHIGRARENGVTQEEVVETITHLAFYAGWPNAVSAVAIAKDVFKAQ